MARQANQQRAGSVRIVTGPEAGSESGCGPEVNGEEAVMMEIDGDAEIKHAWEAKSVDSPGWNAELMTPGKALMRVMQFGLELSNAGKVSCREYRPRNCLTDMCVWPPTVYPTTMGSSFGAVLFR